MALAKIVLTSLIIAASCWAETISLRAARDQLSTGISFRRKSSKDYRFIPPLAASADHDVNDDLQLQDILLVASVDGKFHALNRTSGHALWSMASSAASTVPPGLAPLIRTAHVETDPDLFDDEGLHQELYVIEPQTGDIFVMPSSTSPLQRLPLSMSQLVDLSPFSFAGEEDRQFLGRKETSLIVIELQTGKVKATFNTECPWDPFEDLAQRGHLDPDSGEADGKEPCPGSSEVLIGRTGELQALIRGAKFCRG
jgi:serine/threonine-protein kinase/endoribonuclease IRE1